MHISLNGAVGHSPLNKMVRLLNFNLIGKKKVLKKNFALL